MSIKLLNGIAAVLMFVALVIGCKTNVSSTSETFSVTFGVEEKTARLKQWWIAPKSIRATRLKRARS